jgi:deazaflavin-dependent oxidoreductase (nitroreductase family)
LESAARQVRETGGSGRSDLDRRQRTNALVYARDGADYLAMAPNGGADRDPAWLFNLRAKPEVEIQIGRERQKASARILEPADPDYGRLRKIADGENRDRYSVYQEPTKRPIPVVVITPG